MSISRISVAGYKSIRDRIDLDLPKLTILAGANSSGKSSVMQSLLLLKQTYEAGYDPGPLRIDGPNVSFSRVSQMTWRGSSKDAAHEMMFGLRHDSDHGVDLYFTSTCTSRSPLKVSRTVWFSGQNSYDLAPRMATSVVDKMFSDLAAEFLKGLSDDLLPEGHDVSLERDRSALVVNLVQKLGEKSYQFIQLCPGFAVRVRPLDWLMRSVIHVPGLRGNPERSYSVAAVEPAFPGVFQSYTASVIASWGSGTRKRKSLVRQLGELGLTSEIRAKRRSDTEVDLLVGRLGPGLNDSNTASGLVSVADVGFGVGQVLPVLTALLAADSRHLVFLEQPEIHLHPKAQYALAGPIVEAVDRDVQVVVETHSELLLMAIQRMVAEGRINQEDVALYWFRRPDDGVTDVQQGKLDAEGAYGDWPVDFASTSMSAMRDYIEAARRAHESQADE
ncbi:MAG: AAA family ATPase [Anaerolineales bacterium]|nr:AAA family ATPase [Anaerolineales bacterium]